MLSLHEPYGFYFTSFAELLAEPRILLAEAQKDFMDYKQLKDQDIQASRKLMSLDGKEGSSMNSPSLLAPTLKNTPHNRTSLKMVITS